MRALYREQEYVHGDYKTISLFPVFETGRRRGKRCRPTSDVQQRLNEFNARERLGRQLDANFTAGEGFWTLTFEDGRLPETRAAAIRVYQAFKRRLKRYMEREGLGEMRMAAVYHGDAGGNRLHIHAVIGGDLSAAVMQTLWGHGYVSCRPLAFGKLGLRGLAEYMLKGVEWGRVMTTRNLVDPQPRERTGKISRREVEEIYDNWDDKRKWEGRWPGYEIAEVRPFYNWYNRHYYLRVYLYKC